MLKCLGFTAYVDSMCVVLLNCVFCSASGFMVGCADLSDVRFVYCVLVPRLLFYHLFFYYYVSDVWCVNLRLF